MNHEHIEIFQCPRGWFDLMCLFKKPIYLFMPGIPWKQQQGNWCLKAGVLLKNIFCNSQILPGRYLRGPSMVLPLGSFEKWLKQVKTPELDPWRPWPVSWLNMWGMGCYQKSADIIVENGGDIFISASQPVTIGILAGNSPLSGKIGVRLSANTSTMAICTSSGLVGPSLSKGRAEAVSIVSRSCPLADAAATAVANQVQTKKDLQPAVDIARSISGVEGVVIIKGDAVAMWGDLDIVPV